MTSFAESVLDDFDRDVYCLAGLPFDAVDMPLALSKVRNAVRTRAPCFLSTPNLNFLIACRNDAAFRDSVIHSELNIVDGMPLVWMARLLRIPFYERVAGSNLFYALEQTGSADAPVRIYFFGGPDGVAEKACRQLNLNARGLICFGFQSPGFGSIEEMSGEDRIAQINAANADFLVVAMGARKGQAWIEHNRAKLHAPVISHLGAVVNFVAGTVRRAPKWMQRCGLEWAWRIKEEPALWRRYWQDGVGFLRLLYGNIFPYAVWLAWHRSGLQGNGIVSLVNEDAACRLRCSGDFDGKISPAVRAAFRDCAAIAKPCILDVSGAGYLGPGFFGMVLMLKKHMDAMDIAIQVDGASLEHERFFRWNGVEYLLG